MKQKLFMQIVVLLFTLSCVGCSAKSPKGVEAIQTINGCYNDTLVCTSGNSSSLSTGERFSLVGCTRNEKNPGCRNCISVRYHFYKQYSTPDGSIVSCYDFKEYYYTYECLGDYDWEVINDAYSAVSANFCSNSVQP